MTDAETSLQQVEHADEARARAKEAEEAVAVMQACVAHLGSQLADCRYAISPIPTQ